MNKVKKAFTLVEIIVVLSIISILSTLGFVAYTDYLVAVRDSSRLQQTQSLYGALELYSTRSQLPLGNNMLSIVYGNSQIGFQGDLDQDVLDKIRYNDGGRDPKTKDFFTYFVSENRKHTQILSYHENESISHSSSVYAQEFLYDSLFPRVIGENLGILLQSITQTPVNRIEEISTHGVLDLQSSTGSFIAYVNNESILNGDIDDFIAMVPNTSCKKLQDILILPTSGKYKINPTGVKIIDVYCDMEIDGGGWTLAGVTESQAFPPGNFLDGEIGDTPTSKDSGGLYSMDASDIPFDEVIMGIVGEDEDKYYGFNVPTGFERNRAFESANSGTETCISYSNYYTYDGGITKYWQDFRIFEETLVTNRFADAAGGIDLGAGNCAGWTRQSLAVYRVDAGNSCAIGVCSNSLAYTQADSLSQTPGISGVSSGDLIPEGMSDVWIMVR